MNNKGLVICVTGATGFIGQDFARRCERERGVKLKLLTRFRPDVEFLSNNTHYVRGDLLDYESLLSFVDPGSVLVHLAYLFGRSREENIEALGCLTRACRKKGISRFVQVSSTGVTGDSNDPVVTESTPCQPTSEYELTKLEMESLIIQQLGDCCDVAILRPTCVFGAGGEKVIKLVEDLVSDSSIVSYLKRSLFHRRRLNLVCAENVVEAVWLLSSLKHDLRGERFIVSDDDVPENNYEDVSDYLATELAIKVPRWPRLPLASSFLPIALTLLGGGHRNPHKTYTCEKLERLGYQKAVGFQEGLRRFVEWYRLQNKQGI